MFCAGRSLDSECVNVSGFFRKPPVRRSTPSWVRLAHYADDTTCASNLPFSFFACFPFRSQDKDYGLLWKVMGYDDRYPEDGDLTLFDRVGVYGTLKGNDIHHNYMGACESIKLGLSHAGGWCSTDKTPGRPAGSCFALCHRPLRVDATVFYLCLGVRVLHVPLLPRSRCPSVFFRAVNSFVIRLWPSSIHS